MLRLFVAAFLCVTTLHTVTGLDCYRCTYIEINPFSNEAAEIAEERFSQLSSDRCKSTKDGYLYGVNKITCPPAQDGYVNKCVILDGSVYTSLDIVITIMRFQYHTLTRDCVQVDKHDHAFSDGCHNEMRYTGTSETVRRLLNGPLEGMKIGDVEYSGTACYYDHLTAAVGRVYHAPAVTVTLLMSLFLAVVA